MKIFIATSSFAKEDPVILEYCRKKHEVVLNPFGRKLKPTELIELAKGADGIIAGTETINKEVLEKLPALKVISRCGVGMENVDLIAAKQLGVKVYNTPDAPTTAVAELTIALMLDLLRKISFMDRGIRSGKWNKEMGGLLAGKNVGIIGLGRIGSRVAEILSAFKVSLSYFDILRQDKNGLYKFKLLNELLQWSDIITLHCSVADSKPIIGKKELKSMKDGALLINVSRGLAVDENALYDELKSGRLGGAALDVFSEEPYSGPIRGLENVVLTPHIGSYAKEARIEMEMQAVKNLLTGLNEAR